MKKFRNIFLVLILSCFVFCLFADAGQAAQLADIESAVIEKDYQESARLSEEFLSQNNNRYQKQEASFYLGLSRLYLGQYDKARQAFLDLLDQDPYEKLYDKASIGVIDSYQLENKYDIALDKALGVLEERKDSEFLSLIYLKIARSYIKLAEWEKADQFLKKIIKEFPQSLESQRARQLIEAERYFSVQVGSFLDREYAMTLAEELKNKNEYAYILETTDDGGNLFYRVRVGQFAQLDEAKHTKKKLSGLGYPARIYP